MTLPEPVLRQMAEVFRSKLRCVDPSLAAKLADRDIRTILLVVVQNLSLGDGRVF